MLPKPQSAPTTTIRNWDGSRRLLARAAEALAGGVSSPFRAKASVPLYFRGGEGSRLEDVDGNRYIDYVLAWGPMILGYRHPRLVEAVRRQADQPFSYGAQHELEIEVAEAIQRMVPCAERVAFTSSGSEAIQLAFRLARAHTRRPLILKFEGHYHGWMDTALMSYHPEADQLGPLESPSPVPGSCGQVANAAETVVVSPWNHRDILGQVLERHAGQVAAVIMEPVLCNSGCLLPEPGYLQAAADLCRRHGCLLIFDEVITGFRMSPGGAQQRCGVVPDLATFGKAVGGGVPLSVIAGRKEILEQMFSGGVAFGGTFNGNPLSLGGAAATLAELSRDDGAALAHANRMGERLMEGIAALAGRHGIPLRITGFGAAFALHFTRRERLTHYRDTLDDDRQRLQRYLKLALEQGLHLIPDGRMYVSAAHTPDDVAETLEAIDRVFASLN